MDFPEFPQRHGERSVPQGLKADGSWGWMSGLKPGPTRRQSSHAGANARCGEVAQRILNRFTARLKSCPDTKHTIFRSLTYVWLVIASAEQAKARESIAQ